MDPVAEFLDVSVEYPSVDGTINALRNVNAGFERGSSTAVVGRSGSGKSTLISVLSLMRRPSSGTVMLDGARTSGLSDHEIARLRSNTIGIVFQSFHLDPSLTATENVLLPWFFSSDHMSRNNAIARAQAVLDQLGLGSRADRKPNELSGGERQRVAIGRALFPNPPLLVADEPTGNLDEDTASRVAGVLYSLTSSFKTTVVVVTHDAAVAGMADRQLKLVRGELS